MLTLDNLYERAKADLESFAQAREGAVHQGAETAELARPPHAEVRLRTRKGTAVGCGVERCAEP